MSMSLVPEGIGPFDSFQGSDAVDDSPTLEMPNWGLLGLFTDSVGCRSVLCRVSFLFYFYLIIVHHSFFSLFTFPPFSFLFFLFSFFFFFFFFGGSLVTNQKSP